MAPDEKRNYVKCTPTKRKALTIYKDKMHLTYDEILEQEEFQGTGISRDTLQRNYRAVKGNDGNCYLKAERPGRPKVMSKEDIEMAERLFDNDRAQDASDLQRRYFPHIPLRTVQDTLNKAGLIGFVEPKKPLLKPHHIDARLSFALQHQLWIDTVTFLKAHVFFSDEKKFKIHGSDGISQAHEYDKALLKGWKGDMEGMLLFSALYSATLTALIVESYKKLQLDPADLTTSLLTTMISLQLASSNGTTMTVGLPDTSFKPMTSSLICNMLWFLSLTLALTCSLLATFVQQWTRDFLHKTTMWPSPVVQARVLAFSYFGLRCFGLHTFVDVIPILLHISLFFFFAGLVAFLLPVNLPLTILMACVLFIFVLIYSALTLHPLLSLDTPYCTPLSNLFWRITNGFAVQKHGLSDDDLSLTKAMIEKSLHKSPDWDGRCMEFTMKSMDHDTELVPMLEAVFEAITSPQASGVRLQNFGIVAPLIQSSDPEKNMISHIQHFISASGSLTGDPQHQVCNMQLCLSTLNSFARLVIRHAVENIGSDYSQYPVFWFQCDLLELLSSLPSLPKGHLISTITAL
ncbi:hypothetical protein D9758_011392 [Tetrapyrgos nigripes]|uniref:Transposase Tc1-like domain-containing protein n=1 Tax=Tetrapyrgos nigripes TaxID=182062 RepID=A0A8H5CSK7_9AGAR|nr:hypothetical protein D9758_011392 [Tetrapyrgos nigripes]